MSGIVRRKSISDISNTSLKVLFNANHWSEMWHWREIDARTHRTPKHFVQNGGNAARPGVARAPPSNYD
jgi:hypothetical protein